jgi:hypothetical protein
LYNHHHYLIPDHFHLFQKETHHWAWWCTSVISAFRRLGWENHKWEPISKNKIQKKKPFSSHSILPSPQTLLTTNLSQWICLLWTFPISGIIQYAVFFYKWLLLLSRMFSGFTHSVACISTSFLFMAE